MNGKEYICIYICINITESLCYESKEELKSLLMKVKRGELKSCLNSTLKIKIPWHHSLTSQQTDETVGSSRLYFLGSNPT